MSASDVLHSAIDNPANLRRLVAAGGDIEARDDWDCTPLFHAVLAGNLESVQILIEAGADLNATAGEPGCTILASRPLTLAMELEYLMDHVRYGPIVKRLRAAGASLGSSADSSHGES
jgi:hypothetical protein